MKLFTRGDWEGFFAAFVNNLVQLLILAPLCMMALGFSASLIFGTILPGVAISFLVGNLFYAWQAKKLAEKEGRDDVCALPYGISTPGIFAHIFLVMLPAKQLAISQGLPDPEYVAWQAGLVATLAGGLVEFSGAFFADKLRRLTPRPAMLATLAGVGMGFLGLAFLFQAFASPVVGIVTIALVFIAYFGRVQFLGKIPATLIVLLVGTALSWLVGIAPVGESTEAPWSELGFYFPKLVLGDLIPALTEGHILPYLSVIVPISFLGVVASLQNIESAAAAGDDYPVRPSLVTNGLGTMAAAFCGSPFPTSIYIGHPAWKAMGARAGYSVLNGAFITLVCITGSMSLLTWAIPAEAGLAIILWIGIIISSQAFEATEVKHRVAVVVGIMPGLAAWVMLVVKAAMNAVSSQYGTDPAVIAETVDIAHLSGSFIGGGFALEQGFLYSAMIWSAVVVYIVEREFKVAAYWSFAGAVLAALGLMHSYRLTGSDSIIDLPLVQALVGNLEQGQSLFPAWEFALGYALMGITLLVTPYVAKPETD
ncbi:NCS2 family permease [Pelagicoccus albus]|uniref:NCS2 family permease n=1 Tax=Pelagicoccus albus TaxID=415222 RepID=A0A7X1EBS9_9BACT|nr:NCS2 family permease [Pelagicoccus albus]MBC2608137.1 NCS2 family permease [Pelagicoccus albus]